MSTIIAGHILTAAERRTLDDVLWYLRTHAEDSHWRLGGYDSPKGDGRWISLRDVFPERSNQTNAAIRTMRRLHELGVLQACEIAMDGLSVKPSPLAVEKDSTADEARAGRAQK